MTRNDIKNLFADATDEQITALLNLNNSEVAKEKAKAQKMREDANKAEELQKQLDELNSQNLSDIEKANKERDTALDSVAKLQKEIATMQMRTKLAENGIKGESADKLLESLAGGTLDVDVLAGIISERETAAARAKEQEIASQSTNPNGGNVGAQKEEKSESEKIAESLGKASAQSADKAKTVLDNYL